MEADRKIQYDKYIHLYDVVPAYCLSEWFYQASSGPNNLSISLSMNRANKQHINHTASCNCPRYIKKWTGKKSSRKVLTVSTRGLSLRGSTTVYSLHIWIHSGMPFGALGLFQAFGNKRFVLLDYLKSNKMKTRCLCVFCVFLLEAEEQLVDPRQTTTCVPAEDKCTHSVTYSNAKESLQCSQPPERVTRWIWAVKKC